MPSAFFLVLTVCLAILFPALARFGAVLIDAQPALQLLGPALLLRRRVAFALLLAQRVEFLLQCVVTRPRWVERVSHGRFLQVVRQASALPNQIASSPARSQRVPSAARGRSPGQGRTLDVWTNQRL